MTAAALGTSGSLPEQNPWDSLNLPTTGTKNWNISFFKFNGGQATLQNFGDEPQTSSTRLASFVEARDDEKPGLKGEEATFPQKPQSDGTVVFDNFGDPSYTKLHWKSTGDCWPDPDSIANSGKMFKRHHPEISLGDYSKPFAITFNFKSAETGGALSDEFKITTSQISFDIGGGTSKATKFELLIEGKEYASASGAGGPGVTFRRARFATKEVVGKTGRFRITDNGTEKGDVIAVGNITGEDPKVNDKLFVINSGYGQNADKILRFLYSKFKDSPFKFNAVPAGVDADTYFYLMDEVSAAVIHPKTTSVVGQNFEQVAQKIKDAVDNMLKVTKEQVDSTMLERLYAQGIADWVRTHQFYDKRLLPLIGDSSYAQIIKDAHDPILLLSGSVPGTTCTGFALVCRTLARTKVMSIECDYVDGFLRATNNQIAKERDHGWVVMKFKDGSILPVDASGCRVGLEDARRLRGHIRSYLSLPVTAAEWGMFLSVRYASNVDKPVLFGDKQNKYTFTTQTLDAWRETDTSALDAWQMNTIKLLNGATIFQSP